VAEFDSSMAQILVWPNFKSLYVATFFPNNLRIKFKNREKEYGIDISLKKTIYFQGPRRKYFPKLEDKKVYL
jgi:hypothetical protein